MSSQGKQFNQIIADHTFIIEAINCYYEGNFEQMKGLILDYGEQDFFTDLFQLFEMEVWRTPLNKYYTFVGITRQFFKIYT
jgi:hypothetical protein